MSSKVIYVRNFFKIITFIVNTFIAINRFLYRKAKEKGWLDNIVIILIALFKLVKATILITISVGLYTAFNERLAGQLIELKEQFPGFYIDKLIDSMTYINQHKLVVALGSFVYGSLFFIEGVGLLLGKAWAEYFTIIVTSSFLPLEIYELKKHFTVTKVFVITLNIVIVIYLIRVILDKKNVTL
jgi:uncharacterized membrane protein (DUF2068 family)